MAILARKPADPAPFPPAEKPAPSGKEGVEKAFVRSKRRPRKEVRKRASSNPQMLIYGLCFLLIVVAIAQTVLVNEKLVSGLLVCVAASIALITFFAGRKSKVTKAQADALAERLETIEDHSWEVRESEEVHRSVAETFGDIVFHRDRSGDVVYANENFQKLFGNQTELPEFSEAADGLRARELLIETRKGGRWFQWVDLKVRDTETGESIDRSIARDITRQKRDAQKLNTARRAAEKANETKSRFLATVSHELRTPLNGVIGMSHLLKDEELQPAQREYADAIERSGKALLSMVNDLLDSARIEAGHCDVQHSDTNIRALVEEVAELLAFKARGKGLDVATFVDNRIPETISVDSEKLRQVLLNLLGNAVKFTHTGGVAILVSPCKVGLRFDVVDSGEGLSKQECSSVFDEFVRGQSNRKDAEESTGLGLSICRKLVELMGGEIGVESRKGKGSNFIFTLPARIECLERQSSEKRERVGLLCADTPARSALAGTIAQAGHQTVLAEGAEKLLRLHGHKALDRVVADREILGTGQSEANLLGEINVPVCILGNAGSASKTAGLSPEITTNWLTWPVRQNTLLALLDQTIAHSETQRSENPQTHGPKSLSILFAEDEPINAVMLSKMLGKLGHDVTHVENGREVLEELSSRAGEFDVLFLDLQMPELDGLTTLKCIRSNPDHAGLPVFMLSADGRSETQQNLSDAGADKFLIKPYDPDKIGELLDAIA